MIVIKTYPKIKTLFALERIEGTKKWGCVNGKILPETAPLHFFPIEDLIITEKIDGTNMGIQLHEGEVINSLRRNGGLCERENPSDKFYIEMEDQLRDILLKSKDYPALESVTFFGELCGPKIQTGENYFFKRRFLCFDIYDNIKKCFFRWSAVEHFCNELGIETVPLVEYPYSDFGIDNIKKYLFDMRSVFNPGYHAEGIVIRHKDDIHPIRRYMAKIRRSDFRFD